MVIEERHFPMSTHEDEKGIWDSVADEIKNDVLAEETGRFYHAR